MREEPPKTITQVIDLPIFADPDPGRLEGERWDFTVGIVGSGGDGVITAGEIVESTLSKQGLYCMLVKSFGPQIRGGESYVQVRTSAAPLATEGDALDVLIIYTCGFIDAARSQNLELIEAYSETKRAHGNQPPPLTP